MNDVMKVLRRTCVIQSLFVSLGVALCWVGVLMTLAERRNDHSADPQGAQGVMFGHVALHIVYLLELWCLIIAKRLEQDGLSDTQDFAKALAMMIEDRYPIIKKKGFTLIPIISSPFLSPKIEEEDSPFDEDQHDLLEDRKHSATHTQTQTQTQKEKENPKNFPDEMQALEEGLLEVEDTELAEEIFQSNSESSSSSTSTTTLGASVAVAASSVPTDSDPIA